MLLKQIPDASLAQYSYLIGCQRSGEAIIIDPERDIDRYQDIAHREGLKITALAETHIHADFVSGAREFAAMDPSMRLYLSAEGGADWQSEWAKTLPGFHPLRDGDTFRVGNIEFQAIHTPGHTPEHMVFMVTDLGGGANEPIAMLSGDFLFVGDAGRPDLLEQAAGLEGTQEQGARALYKSLQKIAHMPCHVQILPAHGAGSACGKALGAISNSTLGYEVKFNPALKIALNESEAAFVDFILRGQPEPPAYFANMKRLNKVGGDILGRVTQPRTVTFAEISHRLEDPKFVVLDTRPRDEFLKSHLKKSLFMPPGKFSDFAGSYLTPDLEIVLLLEDPTQANDFVRQLLRIGFDKIVGILPGQELAAAGRDALESIFSMEFDAVGSYLASHGSTVPLDVRKATEFSEGHLKNSTNIAHTRLLPRINAVPAKPLLVNCQSGLRATGACAFLKRWGWDVTCVADAFENAPASLMA